MLHGVGVRARQGWGERTGATAGPAGISLERSEARVASSLTLLGGHPLHVDPLVRAPTPQVGYLRLTRLPHASVRILSARRRKSPADDLPFPGLVREPITDPKLHRQEAGLRGLRTVRPFLRPGLRHRQ